MPIRQCTITCVHTKAGIGLAFLFLNTIKRADDNAIPHISSRSSSCSFPSAYRSHLSGVRISPSQSLSPLRPFPGIRIIPSFVNAGRYNRPHFPYCNIPFMFSQPPISISSTQLSAILDGRPVPTDFPNEKKSGN